MSNDKQSSSIDFFWNQLPEILPFTVDTETAVKLLEAFEQAKQIHNEEMQTQYQDGREIGKIEILTTQSTSNASAYSDGYKKGYLAALEYMNSTIENKIKLRKYEQ